MRRAPPSRVIRSLVLGLLDVVFLAWTTVARDVTPLTRIEEVWNLQGKPGGAPVPVSLDLRSLYYDTAWGLAWLHDGRRLVFVDTRTLSGPLPAGTHALVEAVTLPGLPEIDWRTARATVRPDSGLPPAPALRPGAPSAILESAEWVTVTGIVRSSEVLGGHFVAELVVGGEIGELYVLEGSQGAVLHPNSTVRVAGVFLRADRFSRAGMRFKGFAPSPAQVTTVLPDLSDYFAGPFLDPARLSSVPTPSPVAIRGRVVELGPSNRVGVVVGGRAVDVQALLTHSLAIGNDIEAVGMLTSGTGLRQAVEAALHRQVAPVGSRTNAEYAAVTGSLGAIRAMSRTNLDRGMPVSLTAVVTGNFTPFGEQTVFLQDDTDGIYAYPHTNIFDVKAGDLVKVDGYTSSGLFAPEILIERMTPLGDHRNLRSSSIEIGRLKSGLLDSQWEEVSGLVTRVWRDGPMARLELSDGLEKIEVRLGTTNPPVHLQDTLVRVHGVVATQYNDRRQAFGAHLWCPSEAYVIAQEPPGPKGFQSEPEPIARLRGFQHGNQGPRRAHIRGVVTANGDAGRSVVQSGGDAIQIHGTSSDVQPPGTEVDVLGLVRWDGNRVELRKALIRPGGTVPLPPAIPIPVATIMLPELDGLRTVVTGDLLSVRREGSALDLLVLEDVAVRVRLPLEAGVPPPSGLAPGARVRVTGARIGQFDSEGRLSGYELLAATSNDLLVTAPAPWWTPRHTISTLLATGLVALVAYAWMRSLRIKLRQQAAEIETRFRLQTDLEHRNAELVEQAGEIILRLDAGGIIEDANPAAGRFFGRPAGELVGSALANLFELEDRPRLVLALAKARTEGSGERLEFRCRSGERGLRWLEIQLQSITAPGAAPSLGGVARDISDRKRAEDTLRQSEQNLRRIIEFLPDGVVLLDSRGIIRFQNTRACMLLGHAPGGLVGLPLESLRCPPLDAWVGELLESSDRSPEGLRGGAMRTLDLGRSDGTELPADVSAGAVAHGESRSCLVCFRSAASRLASEETLRAQAAMAKAEA